MKKTPMQIVHEGFGGGMASGTDSWKEFITDDITFDGPAAQVSGMKAFIELNEGFMSMVRGARMKKALEVDNYVITQVEIDVEMPTGKTITLDMSEWYETENGKIKSIKVYYDAEEFRKESA
ncbi:nuclear transport factor 2 family protein [Polaribacter septentrionalilitoris]|uniref:nuclear transport factor 2 family protein n=1 Tax=Polaribacter septentrionalilitoris TaxID=2494657 RepID=UPI00135C1475|nr:nuclear transport factor 2 family protein [Polaribacter septentrionalilitoris]